MCIHFILLLKASQFQGYIKIVESLYAEVHHWPFKESYSTNSMSYSTDNIYIKKQPKKVVRKFWEGGKRARQDLCLITDHASHLFLPPACSNSKSQEKVKRMDYPHPRTED